MKQLLIFFAILFGGTFILMQFGLGVILAFPVAMIVGLVVWNKL